MIQLIIYIIYGVVAGCADIFYYEWRYWALLGVIVAMDVVGRISER